MSNGTKPDDLPPADELPTLRPLLDMLDGVILVAEAGKTDIDDVVDAVHDLESAGCTVLGVVLNKTNATPAVRRGTIVNSLVRRTAALKPAAPSRLARSWRRRPAADATDAGASA